MKTATVTWISYNNYGTILQAYALQRKVEQLGYDNIIISDQQILNEFYERHVYKQKTSFKQSNNTIRRYLRFNKIYRYFMARINRQKYEYPYEDSMRKCKEFKRKRIKITDEKSRAELTDLNKLFDIFIAGSDQIWSVFDYNFNPYYYLDFVNKQKISYAPSLGSEIIPEKLEPVISDLLKDYSAVSVRELKSAEQLQTLTGKRVEWVADPTFLHDREFWDKFAHREGEIKQKFLLCYFLENNPWYFEYTEKVSKELGLKPVLIPNIWDFLGDEYVIDKGIGPEEFVSLIRKASFVITDSYHASIFSLIFEKQFRYLQRFTDEDPESQNIRIKSLFNLLGIEHIIVKKDNESHQSTVLNYGLITPKIEQFRRRSVKYLSDSLTKAASGE